MMDLQYEWKVNQIECAESHQSGFENVVIKVHYTVYCYEVSGDPAQVSGIVILGNPTPHNFEDFESLTEEIVIAWVKNSIEKDGIDKIYSKIQNQVQMRLNPAVIKMPMPWLKTMEN